MAGRAAPAHTDDGMYWLSRLAAGLFVVAVPVVLITSNVRFLAGEQRFYERGFREHDSAQRTGLPLGELDRAAREIISYFEDDRDRLTILVDDDGNEVSLFNAKETQHMEDVKGLMRAIFRLNEIGIAYVLAYVAGVFLWAGAGSLRRLAFLALGGIAVGLVITGVVGALAVTGFDSTWRQFHEIAFRNDLWQLNPDTDRLIQMFPEPFWQEATYIIAAMTAGEALLVVVASVAMLFFGRERVTAAGEPEVIRVRPERRGRLSG
jgi:integral membrane protein (TIGR01906 family)